MIRSPFIISFIVTPNLLYDDGFKEDHNLAGVINYTHESPLKTKSGKITTELLKQIFNYRLSGNFKSFSGKELFEKANQIALPEDELNV